MIALTTVRPFDRWRARHSRLTTTLLAVLTLIGSLVASATPAYADGGHFSLDFIAAEPTTYSHATGVGGVYGTRDIGTQVVESLEGGDFDCGDRVVFFTEITVDASETVASQNIEITFALAGDATGQSGVGYDDLLSASVNGGDPGNLGLDGDEAVTIVSGAANTPPGDLTPTVQITNLNPGEILILRLVSRLTCFGGPPTGNVQSAVTAGVVVGDGAIQVGNQTIPLQNPGDVTGSLQIVKNVTSGNGTFTFDIDCDGSPFDRFDVSITTSGGTGSVTFDEIPIGTVCTVSEDAAPGYTTTVEPAGGVVEIGAQAVVTVTFTNRPNVGSLEVRKSADVDGTFSFDIDCSVDAFDRSNVSITTVGGSGSFTLSGLPTGTTCAVTEDANSAYASSMVPADGRVTIGDGSTVVVRATNVLKRGSLEVRKSADVDGTFSFDIDCSVDAFDRSNVSITTVGGSGSFTLSGLPTGTTCAVTEDANSAYASSMVPADGRVTIGDGSTVVVRATNVLKRGSLEVRKSADVDGTFSFDIDCSVDAFDRSNVSITTVGGSGSFTLSGLPTGTTCTVTEDANSAYVLESVTPAGGLVTIGHDTTVTVSFRNVKLVQLTVIKFYDTDRDGVQDPGESGIAGWQVRVGNQTVTTGANGRVTVMLAPGTYTVTEGRASGWVNTTPRSVQVTLPPDSTVRFGNVCLGAGGGRTLGFWSNRNGQQLVGADDLAMLVGLNLRNGDGSAFDPANYTSLRRWLLDANATNMSYMLSVQMAAMRLNVFNGLVSGDSLVYAPGVAGADALGFVSVSAVLAAANAALGADGSTPSGDPNRAVQEALKNALDQANNNQNFLQTTPCPAPRTFTF